VVNNSLKLKGKKKRSKHPLTSPYHLFLPSQSHVLFFAPSTTDADLAPTEAPEKNVSQKIIIQIFNSCVCCLQHDHTGGAMLLKPYVE